MDSGEQEQWRVDVSSGSDVAPKSRSRKRRWFAAFGVVFVLFWIGIVHPYLRIAAGYSATIGAMQHFATGDDLDVIRRERIPAQIGFVSMEVDEASQSLEARALYVTRRAIFRNGLGATRVQAQQAELPDSLEVDRSPLPDELPWPTGSSSKLTTLATWVDQDSLTRVVDEAFSEGLGTHALIVVHRGQLVIERYREGYGPQTPFLGWSMTKSVTATLFARLLHEGKLSMDAAPAVPLWADDGRREIRFDDLLRMRSGLAFYQDHASPMCQSLQMLFVTGDCADFATRRDLEHEPGEQWYYSDGTTNILARLVLNAHSPHLQEQLRAPRELLFDPIGMRSAFIAVDGAGTFVGSSLMYASARDWARFGWLYAADGVWQGRRLLPEGWVDYVATPTENSDGRRYGAHFWRFEEGLAAGVFSAQGYQGQFLFIDRERQLVSLRLGVNPAGFDERAFCEGLVTAFSR